MVGLFKDDDEDDKCHPSHRTNKHSHLSDESDENDEDDGGVVTDELDPKLVKEGKQEEVEYMVDKLNMFEFADYETATRRGGKEPTTTTWVEGWKTNDDGWRFVRCRLVGRDFKERSGGERDHLFAAMLEPNSKDAGFEQH